LANKLAIPGVANWTLASGLTAYGARKIQLTPGYVAQLLANLGNADQLKALWLMENGLTDASGNGYTLSNSGVTFTDSSPIHGSYSALFDANTDRLSQATILDTTPGGGVSLELFFKSTATFDNGAPDDMYLFDKRNVSGANRIIVYFTASDGKLNFFTEARNGGNRIIKSTTASWSSSTVYHVVFVWSDIYGKELWVNGVKENTDANEINYMVNGTAEDFTIGNLFDGSGLDKAFLGKIDQVGVYAGKLADSVIAANYAFSGSDFYSMADPTGTLDDNIIPTTEDGVFGPINIVVDEPNGTGVTWEYNLADSGWVAPEGAGKIADLSDDLEGEPAVPVRLRFTMSSDGSATPTGYLPDNRIEMPDCGAAATTFTLPIEVVDIRDIQVIEICT
jgi:hypothetical protein